MLGVEVVVEFLNFQVVVSGIRAAILRGLKFQRFFSANFMMIGVYSRFWCQQRRSIAK